jgi:hypothetical protein
VVSPGDWLVSSIWFLLSMGQVAIGSSDNSASLCRMVRAVVVFTRRQLRCPTAVQSADSCKQLWKQPVGRNGAIFLSALWHREAFYKLGSRMSQSSILIEALSLVCPAIA